VVSPSRIVIFSTFLSPEKAIFASLIHPGPCRRKCQGGDPPN